MSALLKEPPAKHGAEAPRGSGTAYAPTRRRPGGRLLHLFHKTWESLRIALGSLRANKLRTALTLIGVVVGVAAVIAVVTIIRGLDQTVATTFSSQGSTVFTVSKRPRVITSREDFIKFNKRKDVSLDDAEAIFRACTSCCRSGVAANTAETVKHKDQKSENVSVRGITPSAMFDIDAVNIDAG